jgi:hypothetical protein
MIADVAAGIFVLALVYVLVRPRSAAAEMVGSFGNAVVALVKTAVDI